MVLTANATNTIKGSINQESGTIQVLIRNSPFDSNITLLTESTISEGQFELSFELPFNSEIIFSVNDLTVSKQILKGSLWEVELNIIELTKPGFFGNTQRLELKQVVSSDELESKLFEFESDIESIRENNRKGSGKIGKQYFPQLEKYLIEVVSRANSTAFKRLLSTSKTFAFSLSRLQKSKSETKPLEEFFESNFQPSFNGLTAVNILHAQPLQIEYLSKNLNSNYFEWIRNATEKISDDKVKQATIAILITNALGRKWTDQNETKKELARLTDQCNYSELKKWLEAFRDYHSNSLIGTNLKDFELENPSGGKIRFSDYKGKYLLLDFWATWCGPCIKNMKKLPEVKNQNSNLEILCITTEQDTSRINKFITRNGYQKSLDFGIAKNNDEIDSYFNKRAIPLYFLVNPDGVIIDKAVSDPTEMIDRHLNP